MGPSGLTGEALWVASQMRGVADPRHTRPVMACWGRAFGDCTRLIMGCLGEGQKVGKGRDQGVLEKDHYGAQDKGMSGAGDAHTGFSPVPFPGPALHLTPALSLAFV